MDLSGTKEIGFPPVTVDGREYDRIVLSEPTVEQMIRIEGIHGLNAAVMLIKDIAGVPAEVVRKMPISAMREADRFLSRFTDGGAGDATTSPAGSAPA